MTVICKELFASRSEKIDPDQPSAERLYHIIGTSNPEVAKAQVLAPEPFGIAKFHGQYPLKSWEIERVTPDCWAVSATYERPETPETDGPEEFPAFDISSTSVHVENSYRTIGAYGPRAVASRVGKSNPIGFDGTTIQGVDILESVLTISIQQTLAREVVTNDFVKLLASLVGKVNEQIMGFAGEVAFLGWPAGCVLFLGAQGQRKEDWSWDVTYNFGVRDELPATTIGDVVVPARPGWSHTSIEWMDRKVYTGGSYINGQQPYILERVPAAIYVDQVYASGALHQLSLEGF